MENVTESVSVQSGYGPAHRGKYTPIPRRKPGEPVPVSFAQERLWFLDHYYPNSPIYNIPAPIPFTGVLDPDVSGKALREIVNRHESLRTTFHAGPDGSPVQNIAPLSTLELPVVDLQSLSEQQRQYELARVIADESSRVFSLTDGPLFCASLIRLRKDFQYLFLNMHHIVSDAWSMGVLMNEFRILYDAFSKGQSSALEPLPIQYADFSVWQRQWLGGSVLDEQLAYWRQQLNVADSTLLELPSDRPRLPFLTFRGATISFVLPYELSERLRRFASASGATPFMVLLAGFKTLLHRYTGQNSLIVGFPTANRTRSELEKLIGFFVNSLPVHTRISGATTFRTMVRNLRDAVLGALAPQDLPFEKLVAELAPERNVNANPIFQVMFDFQNSAMPASPQSQPVDSASTQESQSPMTPGTSKFDLSLSMGNAGRQLCGTLEFSTDMFDEGTIRRFISCFHAVLKNAVDHPDRSIKLLDVIPESERRQIVQGWNATDTAFPDDKCMHSLFEAQVERTPHAIAVRFRDQSITYDALNKRTNQLAHYLLQQGVRRESIVGICMDGCPELVIAVLAVLKAGGAYLPIDPAYPGDRIAFMIEDAKVQLVLAHSLTIGSPSSVPGVSVVPVDRLREILDGLEPKNPRSASHPSNACYVIYTSGSTGRPKGVVVEHRSVANLIHASIPLFSIREASRILQFSSFSFDVSVREIFESLLSGAAICLARRDELTPGDDLLRVMREHAITTVTLAPSVWAYLPDADLPALRCAIAGGEACSAAIVDRWAPDRDFFNAYGPTEVTVASSVARCVPGSKPTIGMPLPNTKYYVADAQLQLCIPGTPGELLIGGVGVSRGYLGRPKLTAERFVPDPFARRAGGRLYRSGDLVRQLPDGNIDYLGRIDSQVKIRGFRIELGEIEAVLADHSDVATCTVNVYQKSEYDRHLVAYVVRRGNAEPRPEALKAFIAFRLPQYMVPQSYIFLDKIPLTPAGKVDVRALPTPEQAQRRATYVAPVTEMEQLLAELWADILKTQPVGIHDNFFEIGGHSLLVMQVVSRLQERVGGEIPLRVLFENPTIAELAAHLNGNGLGRGRSGIEPPSTIALVETPPQAEAFRARELQPVPGFAQGSGETGVPAPSQKGPISSTAVMSFAQERLWFLQQFESESTAYNVIAPLEIHEPVSVPALTRAFTELIRRHEVLRTVFKSEKGVPSQVIFQKSNSRLEVVDLRGLPRSEAHEAVKMRVQAQGKMPFDLVRGPLFRGILFQIADDDNLLMLFMHHIICDAWSLGILSSDLWAFYKSFCLGEPPSLPALERQYREFAAWQRATLQGEALAGHLRYYREQLEGTPPFLNLPYKQSIPRSQAAQGRVEAFVVPPDAYSRLKQLSQTESVTLFMLLLASVSTLLNRYTGEEHIVIGTPISSRTRREFERTVGLLTNTLVLHTDLSSDPTFREVLRRVRAMTVEAYAHQDLPFERLVSEINPERNLNATPLFQVMLVLQEGPVVFREPGGQTVSGTSNENGAAKFDLTFYFEQSASGISGAIEYNAELFESSIVAGFIKHFLRVLETAAVSPDRPISSLPLVATAELEAILKPSPTASIPEGVFAVHQIVEMQVRRTPAGIALRTNDLSLTYTEMNTHANQLARFLRNAGVHSESVVASYLGPGVESIVTLLAILKAGGTYLPIETGTPGARIDLMLRESGAVAVVTRTELAASVADGPTRRICLDAIQGDLGGLPADDLGLHLSPANGCYLIYTSGSTGRPKGVLLSHQTLLQLICWQIDGAGAKTLQYSSLAFDVSLQEIFSTLCSGETLVCVSSDQRRDIKELFDVMIRHGVQRVFIPYVALKLWSDFIATTRMSPLPALKEIIVAGEQLRITPAIASLITQLGHCTLINQYGPSESHVVSEHRLSRHTDQWPGMPPVGEAVAGALLYVLDDNLQPVPPGVVGELFIGGDALARGYLSSPSQTAERFVPNPFVVGGKRMYKTGDMVRYDSQGQLQFLHRRDDQIKVRGFRVELGEVEHCLSLLPEIHQAAVTYRSLPWSPSDGILVAYLVPRDGAHLTTRDLLARLKTQLPDYMLPNEIVWLGSLPLSATGKVDRKKLPAPEEFHRSNERPFVAPRSPLEQELADIWSTLLGIDSPGVDDDFFENGGQSILATQLVSAMIEHFGVELSLRQVFEQPTISALAVAIVQTQASFCPESTVGELLKEFEG